MANPPINLELRLNARTRRRAMQLAYANAGLWAVGNGLVASTLVLYLALDLGANNFAASLILAAPFFAGVLRLVVPSLLARTGHRKAFCIASYVASAFALCAVPMVAMPQMVPGSVRSIQTLVVAWCLYQLLEYAGTVALWSWIGDFTPRQIRGRFCGRRERWLVNGRIAGIAASVSLAWLWGKIMPQAPRWEPLAASAAIGAVFMAAAVAPLFWLPAVEFMPSAAPRSPWRAIARATFQRPYRQLVLFCFAFSLVNGMTAAAQGIFPRRVLQMTYPGMQAILAMMRLGQTGLAPTMGRWCDRWGSRPVMIVSQLIVATGPLFFYLATPAQWWWIVVAHVMWIAYAGLNVGLDSVKLKLAPADNNAPYLAVFYAMGDLAYGVSTVTTGWLSDRWQAGGINQLQVFAALFLAGWIGRTLVAGLLMPLEEPGAWRLCEIVGYANRDAQPPADPEAGCPAGAADG